MNPIPVELMRIPLTAVGCAESLNLVERGIVLMDDYPLNNGVCIFSFDDYRPMLIGQKNWSRIYPVFAEPKIAWMQPYDPGRTPYTVACSVERYFEHVMEQASEGFYQGRKAVWMQARNAVRILRRYRERSGCLDGDVVDHCIWKLMEDFKGGEP